MQQGGVAGRESWVLGVDALKTRRAALLQHTQKRPRLSWALGLRDCRENERAQAVFKDHCSGTEKAIEPGVAQLSGKVLGEE